jgi:hypothetical protein
MTEPRRRLLVTLTEPRALRLVFALLLVASLVPIWFVRYQPLTDIGNHLAAARVWHSLHDPRFAFEPYYALRLGANPYWGHYLLLHWLAYPLGLATANRVILSLWAIGLPLGTLALARQLGRSPWLALFAFPLTWSFCFAMGFVNFCLGLVATLFGLVLFDRFCAKPTIARGVGAALLGVVVFFFHLLPWALYVGATGVIGLCHEGRTIKRLAGRVAVWAPSAVVGALVVARGDGNFMGYGVGRMTFKFYSVGANLSQLYSWVWDGCLGHEDEIFAAIVGAAWLALKLTGRQERWSLHALRAEALFVVALAAYLIAPRSALSPFYWWGINIRYATYAVLFLALTVPGAIAGWRRWLLAAVGVVALACTVDTFVHWRRANAWAGGFDEVAAVPPDGARVLTIIYPPWHERSHRHDSARNYYAMLQVERGGYMPWNFDLGFPLVYKERFPAPDWSRPEFRWDQHARWYDYLLTFQGPPPVKLFGAHASEARLVKSAGYWRLYALPGPRVDVPPGPPYPFEWAYDAKWQPPPKP